VESNTTSQYHQSAISAPYHIPHTTDHRQQKANITAAFEDRRLKT
jgi:hypothetical protein